MANAIKYSPAGKTVEIRLSSDERGGKPWCILEVVHQGPGIAPEMVSTLFERFRFGADSKGIGLGLHRVHRIARIHQVSSALTRGPAEAHASG